MNPVSSRSLRGCVTPFLAACIAASLLMSAPASAHGGQRAFRVLVFTKAAGFVHPSIPVAVDAIEGLGAKHHFGVDVTNDAAQFNEANLDRYAAIVFVSTTSDVLPGAAERAAFENYIRDGGGFFGVHAAADMGAVGENWPFYRELVGAAFKGHTRTHIWAPQDIGLGSIYEGPLEAAPADAESFGPTIRYRSWEPALVQVEDVNSPATRGWGRSQLRTDEWYGFLTNPRPSVHVLASLVESTYDAGDGDMGPGAADHPILWCQRYQGGRSVYSGMGHQAAVWSDSKFLKSVLGSIEMAAGFARFDCPAGT